ncbi:MAG: metallophosphoesterase family protein, partial [Oscillospiraceae bacterium]
MICITGDVHGDFTRFNDKRIKRLRKNDCLIICGDFGFLWNGSRKEKSLLKKLGRKRYNVLFVDGCHENFELLNCTIEKKLSSEYNNTVKYLF